MKNDNAKPLTEKEWLSWLYVTLWSVFIFITIPLARSIESVVHDHLGRIAFLYGVIGFVVIACAVTLVKLRKRQAQSTANKLWLLAVGAALIAYTLHLRKNPEEAFHFVQYSVLGMLLFRALTHRVNDFTIYFSVAALGAIIGTLDETIQWITPARYWALSDIWINFLAVALVQIGIAKGVQPTFISGPARANSLLLLCRFLIGTVVLMQLNFLNTPPRIAWCAANIPFLGFLHQNEAVMIEYGYHYNDPDTGFFRSRLSRDALQRIDTAGAAQAAAIIDQYSAREKYGEFLKKYTPVSDPFLHEFRVHLFCRNVNVIIATESRGQPKKYTKYITRAYHENQILEKYFTETLKKSKSLWTRQYVADMKQDIDPQVNYESAASAHLITRISELWVNAIFFFVLGGLIYISLRISKDKIKS